MTPGRRSLKLPALAGKQMKFTEEAMKIIDSLLRVKSVVPPEKYTGECKLLLHELFTNAINHSGSKEVEFFFLLQDDHINIEMITEGPGFKIKPVNPDCTPGDKVYDPPYTGLEGKSFILYLDADFEVVCHVEGANELKLFSRRRKSRITDRKSSIPEHFGLLIITRLGTGVTYIKKPGGKNIFSLKRLLPENRS